MDINLEQSQTIDTKQPGIAEATRIWLKIGLLSFGGPAAQIAMMHHLIVDKLKWLSEKDYLNSLSFCMLLPGPEAMQLATYAGWRLHGNLGGLIAGLLFVLPGALVILLFATIYALFGNVPLVNAIFLGIKAAVLVIVLEALLRVSKRALKSWDLRILALISFFCIFFLNISYPLIVLFAGIYGFFTSSSISSPKVTPLLQPGSTARLFTIVTMMLIIWWLPLLLIDWYSQHDILSELGKFFSRLAIVTFGGAYAVLAYMGQDVVNHWGWLSAGEMMDGLGLAETTPGPLILVTEFVGFLAAYREGGIALGIAGAAITLWVTFVPCFLWIFAGAPYIEWIGSQPKLASALNAISAAVVGVILNLSIWFGLHVMFENTTQLKKGPFIFWQPELSSIDWRVVFLSVLCGILIFGIHWSIQRVIVIAAILSTTIVYLT